MGGHYGSVQLRTADRAAVLAAAEAVAREMNIKCLVGPALNGWVGVYPEGNGQDETVGEKIAAAVGGHGLHLLVHDDDILAYWLWADGKLVDRYHSAPGYFGEENRAEEEPLVGEPERFAFVLEPAARADLRELLRRDDGPTFEYERLGKLGELLGIGNAVSAYEYLKGGETDDVTGWPRRFKEVPAGRVRADRKREDDEAARIAAERQRLRSTGQLLVSQERTDLAPIGCAAAEGFIIVYPDLVGGGSTTVEHHRPPWDGPAPVVGLELPTKAHVNGVATDATGRRLAMGAGQCVRVWDWDGDRWRHLTDIPERDLTITVAVSRDGARVAHASRERVVVTDLASGQTVTAFGRTGSVQGLAFHPSGEWLGVAGGTLDLVPLDGTGDRRQTCVGGAVTVQAEYLKAIRARTGAIDVDAVMATQRAAFEKTVAKMAAPGKWGTTSLTPEQLAAMRQQIEQRLAENRERYARLRRDGPPPQPPTPREACMCVGFDTVGKHLWAGTTVGLRVYDCPAVLAGSGDELPPPVFSAELPPTPQSEQIQLAGTYVHAAAVEAGNGGLVFGGMGTGLFRLDLSTGNVRLLTFMPGGGHVVGLVMSSAGTALGVRSHRWSMASLRRQEPQRWAWEVWAYPRLLTDGM